MAARKRESEGRNSDPGRLGDGFGARSVLAVKNTNIYKVFCKVPKTYKKVAKTTIFTRFSAKIAQKHQKNTGFSSIYAVFCKKRPKTQLFTRFSVKNGQTQQYLQGFLKKACTNINIYKVFCKKQAQTAIFTRFSAKSVQK